MVRSSKKNKGLSCKQNIKTANSLLNGVFYKYFYRSNCAVQVGEDFNELTPSSRSASNPELSKSFEMCRLPLSLNASGMGRNRTKGCYTTSPRSLTQVSPLLPSQPLSSKSIDQSSSREIAETSEKSQTDPTLIDKIQNMFASPLDPLDHSGIRRVKRISPDHGAGGVDTSFELPVDISEGKVLSSVTGTIIEAIKDVAKDITFVADSVISIEDAVLTPIVSSFDPLTMGVALTAYQTSVLVDNVTTDRTQAPLLSFSSGAAVNHILGSTIDAHIRPALNKFSASIMDPLLAGADKDKEKERRKTHTGINSSDTTQDTSFPQDLSGHSAMPRNTMACLSMGLLHINVVKKSTSVNNVRLENPESVGVLEDYSFLDLITETTQSEETPVPGTNSSNGLTARDLITLLFLLRGALGVLWEKIKLIEIEIDTDIESDIEKN